MNPPVMEAYAREPACEPAAGQKLGEKHKNIKKKGIPPGVCFKPLPN